MTITVQLFGPQATLASARELSVDAPDDNPTAAGVLRELRDAVPELATSLATSRLAINHEFAADDTPIRPGDEVALIGMVSGG